MVLWNALEKKFGPERKTGNFYYNQVNIWQHFNLLLQIFGIIFSTVSTTSPKSYKNQEAKCIARLYCKKTKHVFFLIMRLASTVTSRSPGFHLPVLPGQHWQRSDTCGSQLALSSPEGKPQATALAPSLARSNQYGLISCPFAEVTGANLINYFCYWSLKCASGMTTENCLTFFLLILFATDPKRRQYSFSSVIKRRKKMYMLLKSLIHLDISSWNLSRSPPSPIFSANEQ